MGLRRMKRVPELGYEKAYSYVDDLAQ